VVRLLLRTQLPLVGLLGHGGEGYRALLGCPVASSVVERIGLVGLPNSGKSSLFNALTGREAPVANHPFTTTETSVGVAGLPDHRLDALAEMSKSKKVVRAGVEMVDIAGLVAGSSTGEGLGNRFLGGIREVDALLFVLRAFEDPEVPGDSDPLASFQTLELELVLADLASIESQIYRKRKSARADKSLGPEVAAMEEAQKILEGGVPLYRAERRADQSEKDAEEERQLRRSLFLLTDKPVLAVVNVGEDQIAEAETFVKGVADELGGHGDVLAACVQLEAEAAQLSDEERAEMSEELGLGEGALARVARSAYHLLGRRTFLTTGDKESRAWSFRTGATAPECAGVIHSDLQRGFIRAEVIHWDELLEIGSWNAAKAAGRIRVEGSQYVVDDGDVLEIRFNV
jgi:GTP-binding protein YchF